MSKKTLNFKHEIKQTSIKDGDVEIYEEVIMDGSKGLTIKYFHKNKKETNRILIYGSKDEYTMKTQTGDVKDDKKLTKSEMTKEVEKNKKLAFAKDYVKTQKGGAVGKKSGSKKSGSKKSGSKKHGSKKHGSKK
jgi:hypothetical protein